MKKILSLGVIASLMLAGIGLAGTASAENVYQYVDVSGNLRTEVADNPTEALNNAENRHPNSGVMLTSSSVLGATIGTTEQQYWYVDVYGNLQMEIADNPFEAIANAEMIDPNSGVAEVR